VSTLLLARIRSGSPAPMAARVVAPG